MATVATEVRRARTATDAPQQGLSLTYHRLMLVMLLFVGVTLVVVARLAQLQLFTDRSGQAAAVDPLLPPRGDIVDRNGVTLARTIDAWAIAARPRDIIGDRAALAGAPCEPGRHREHAARQARAGRAAGRRSHQRDRRRGEDREEKEA